MAASTAALVLLAGAVTVAAPVPALLLSPLLLGVPHLLGDLWVLFLRPAAVAGIARWVAAPLFGLIGLRALALAGVASPPLLEVLVGSAAIVLGAASTRSIGRVALACLLCLPAWLVADKVSLVLGHLHNFVALGLLILWGPRRLAIGVAGAVLVIFAAILSGAVDPTLAPFAGLTPTSLGRALAPGLSEAWAIRWTLAYCFAQLVHYLVWIWLLPILSRDTGGRDRSFVQALVIDVGRPLLLAGAVGGVGLLVAGALDPTGIRAGYLSLVAFHGWMELAVLAGWRRGAAAR